MSISWASGSSRPADVDLYAMYRRFEGHSSADVTAWNLRLRSI